METKATTSRRCVLQGIAVAAGLGIGSRAAFGDSIGATWNQWRGPRRDGHVSGATWPDSLTEANLKSRWRKKLGPSYSGPIVSDDFVFTTETKDRKSEIVVALARTDGSQRWQAEWLGTMSVPFFAKSNGDWIRSTPAFDGENLFVGGMNDYLVAINGKTGKQAWAIDFPAKFSTPKPAFGLVCSPLLHGDSLYVQAGASVARVHRVTGEVVWRSAKDEGGMWGSAFSSPIIATVHGVEQCIVQTRTRLVGVELESGRELWTQNVEAFRGMNILTPTVLGDQVFTSAYGGKTQLFSIARQGETWSVSEVWQNKLQGYMSSPVVIDGVAYVHLRNQRFAAVEWQTGKELWTTRPFGKYWSIVAHGKRMLALDENGMLRLIQANREKFELISEVKVATSGDSWAHLAVEGSQLFVREIDSLIAFDWIG